MDIAGEIRSRVSSRAAAEHYGYDPNRSGFIQCPFHSGDHTASLKFFPDGGWHCFGCGRGGSSIDFVMELFDLTFPQACVRINSDFALGLPMGRKPTRRERMLADQAARERRLKKEAEERAEEEELALIAEHRYWWEVMLTFEPDTPDYVHPLYEEAVKRLPALGHQIDEIADKRWSDR